MRQGIHPEYQESTVRCSCGNTFTTRATKPELRVELCNECHPFYTGQQKFVDTGGRVQRFADKFKTSATDVLGREAASREAKRAAAESAAAEKKAARDAKAAEKAARAAEFKVAEPAPAPVEEAVEEVVEEVAAEAEVVETVETPAEESAE